MIRLRESRICTGRRRDLIKRTQEKSWYKERKSAHGALVSFKLYAQIRIDVYKCTLVCPLFYYVTVVLRTSCTWLCSVLRTCTWLCSRDISGSRLYGSSGLIRQNKETLLRNPVFAFRYESLRKIWGTLGFWKMSDTHNVANILWNITFVRLEFTHHLLYNYVK